MSMSRYRFLCAFFTLIKITCLPIAAKLSYADVEQIEKKLQETIDCVYTSEVDKLCSLHVFQLVHVLKSASPAGLKDLIMSYNSTSQHDETAYRKRYSTIQLFN